MTSKADTTRRAFAEQRRSSLTTKFAIRPAPRKKPWVCKRSPPCLVPDPIPASVLCTYELTIDEGPFTGYHTAGTFTVPNVPPTHTYRGADPDPHQGFWIEWTYYPLTNNAHGWSQYGPGPYHDMGDWHVLDSDPPPSYLWKSYHLQGSTWAATGWCLITG